MFPDGHPVWRITCHLIKIFALNSVEVFRSSPLPLANTEQITVPDTRATVGTGTHGKCSITNVPLALNDSTYSDCKVRQIPVKSRYRSQGSCELFIWYLQSSKYKLPSHVAGYSATVFSMCPRTGPLFSLSKVQQKNASLKCSSSSCALRLLGPRFWRPELPPPREGRTLHGCEVSSKRGRCT